MIDVSISKSSSDDTEFIIRDKNKIVIGRFNVFEIDKENKKSSVKLKFYRKEERTLLKQTIGLMLNGLFKKINIKKVNIYIPETIDVAPFLDSGFVLEGILSNNIYSQGIYYNELVMGINRNEYILATRSDFTEIHSKNLTLRILTPEDAQKILEYNIRNRLHLEMFEPKRDNSFYTIGVQNNILQESYRQFLNGTALDFGIFKNGKIIGKVKISNIVYGIFRNGIIGYSMDKEEQGKGYMKEAVNRIVEYAFDEIDLHRIEASALVDNEKSKHVLLGCGFKEIGINKKYLFINGKWRDHITYYKIKDK